MEGKKGIAENLKEARKVREKCGSYGSIEEMWKRKREESMKEEKGENGGIFNKSRKTQRSPEMGKNREEGATGETKKGEEELGKWKKEMEGVMKEVMRMGLKEWKDEMKLMKEEMREGMKDLRMEMKDIREREYRWKEEKEANKDAGKENRGDGEERREGERR